jgi:hypothetical protein
MEYLKSPFKQFEVLIQEHSPVEVFESGVGVTVSWYECADFKLSEEIPISKELSDNYIRVDTNNEGITRVEGEFINLPDNELEMGWYFFLEKT